MTSSSRHRWRSLVTVAAVTTLSIGIIAAPASALPPRQGQFEVNEAFVDAEYCADWGFAFDVVHHEIVAWAVYRDTDGDFAKAIVHADIQYNLSANGRTLFERDRITEIYTPDGHREVGLWTHIQGDHTGLVLRDAGRLVFDGDGNLLRADGPHPQYFGETFCGELAGAS
jgi:hypothetical protein